MIAVLLPHPWAAQQPTLLEQPQSQTVIEGNGISLFVYATGIGNLAYQWEKDGTDLITARNTWR